MKCPLLALGLLLASGCASLEHASLGELPEDNERTRPAQDAASDSSPLPGLDAQVETQPADGAAIPDSGVTIAEAGAPGDAGAGEAATPNDGGHDAQGTQHDDDDDRDAALSLLCTFEPWHCP